MIYGSVVIRGTTSKATPKIKAINLAGIATTSSRNALYSRLIFSSYNLSLYLNEDSSTVEGNLTVDFYNNDPVNFTQLPFHIYPSGMRFDTRAGNMDICLGRNEQEQFHRAEPSKIRIGEQDGYNISGGFN